jgi:chemotaxis signal transduction protein
MTGLYVHIPFCLQKCSYCDFYSEDNKNYLINDYIEAIIKIEERIIVLLNIEKIFTEEEKDNLIEIIKTEEEKIENSTDR